MLKQITLFLTTIAMFVCLPMSAAGIVGTAPEAGSSYYIYNVYQAKYLSYGNSYGTQVSVDNNKPLLCTLESSGSGFKINTHYSLSSGAYNSSVTNYMIYTDEGTFVNARWGDSDSNYNDRDATIFSFVEADEGYYITCSNGSLMFDSGTGCVVGDRSEGFNADKSLWRFVSTTEYAEQAAKKTFSVAALNVDGMPVSIKVAGIYTVNLNSDGKEAAGATAIGQKLVSMGFDVIGVSEDFNYNDEIMAQIGSNYYQGTHRGKIDGSLGTALKYLAKETLFDTDGLNLFYKKSSTNATGESWTSWNDHYGYDDHEADGLINKGYRYYLITLSDGTQFDLYITHMEAGSDTGDNEARANQLTQFANAILATNNNRPIIIMGDTNCRYSRDPLKSRFFDVINADPRFTIKDPWVEYGRQGITPVGSMAIMASEHGYRKGEVVDKVFYINNTNSSIRINAEAYRQDLSFVDSSGEALADHWPCVVEFSYHDYDPLIDDVTDELETIEGVYLRNRATGYFLKQGGWWGTHAVQGVYGSSLTFTKLPSGKYQIQTPSGLLSQDDPYMDATSASPWTLTKNGDYYSLIYQSGETIKALTANDPFIFSYGSPNTRYVTCATYSASDTYQQWEMLTRDDLLAEMADATGEYNCTFLLNGANFDRNDPATNSVANGGAWSSNIASDATKIHPNFCDGRGDWDTGNYVAEVFVDSYSSIWTTYGTTWEISQQISGLPSGTYTVKCQGFYRDGTANQNNPGSIHSYLYARTNNNATEVKTTLKSMYSSNCTEALSNLKSTKNSNYYIPNSMYDASQFFSKGYYENSVEIEVTDGTLTVAVGKPDETKSTEGWTCFDNFQIIYHGEDRYWKVLATAKSAKTANESSTAGAVQSALDDFEWTTAEYATKTASEKLEAIKVLTNATTISNASQVATGIIKNSDFSGGYSGAAEGSRVQVPTDWSYEYSLDGWNDTYVDATNHLFNAWAATINEANLYQTIEHIPNGVYKFSADVRVDLDAANSTTALYGSGLNTGRSEEAGNEISGSNESFANYVTYFEVDDNTATIGIRSEHCFYQIKNLTLEYVTDNTSKTVQTDNSYLRNDYYWRGKDAFEYDATGTDFQNASGVKVYPQQANQLIKARNSSQFENSVNKVINGTCANLVITDGNPLHISSATGSFTATNATYNRAMNSAYEWGTIIMPFPLTSDATVQYYEIIDVKDDGSSKSLCLDPLDNVAANTPVIYRKLTSGATSVTMGGTSKSVVLTTEAMPAEFSMLSLTGCYEQEVMDSDLDNIWYIAQNKFWAASTSSTPTFTIPAFRAYITLSGEVKALNLIVSGEDPTNIMTIDAESGKPLNISGNVYTLSGQLVKANAKSLDGIAPGIYVVEGAKVVIRR